MVKKIALGGALLALLVATGFGLYTWTPNPSVDADAIRAQAASYRARIIRDAYGVPHIYGDRDADVAFGVAWAHAEDDWATIETTLLASRGTLAARDGIDAAQTDYLVDWFGIWDVVEAQYDTLAPDTRALIEAYAAGLSLYGLEEAETVAAGSLPITGRDVAAGFMFRTPFFAGLQGDLSALFQDEPAHPIAQKTSSGDRQAARATLPDWLTRKEKTANAGAPVFRPFDRPLVEMGSNGFAVAPGRSDDGHTRLVVNSHQPMRGPVAWYELRVKSNEGWDMVGATFPAAPMVLVGANQDFGWANTVNGPDVVDIYALDVDDPDQPTQYRMDGAWRPVERGEASFRVKLWGPFSWPVTRPILRTEHGPAITVPHGTYAIALSAAGQIRMVEQFWRVNKVRSVAEFRQVMAINAIPSLNYIFATAEGDIGYLYNARWPDRAEGYDWGAYLPGDTSDTLWRGMMDTTVLPELVNPPSGYVINANNTPFRATSPAEDLKPSDFSPTFGIETHMTNRGLRALELFEATPVVGADKLEAIKFDLAYAAGSKIATVIDRLTTETLPTAYADDPVMTKALAILKSWDRRTNVDNTGAALGVLTHWRATTNPSGPGGLVEDLWGALKTAADELMTAHGRLDVAWGEVNRLRRGQYNLPVDGGPDILRAIYGGRSLDENGQMTALAGDTYILFADWDESGTLKARSVHQFGAATLDQRSPHYDDQVPLFVNMAFKDVPLTLETVEAQATRDYWVGGAEQKQ